MKDPLVSFNTAIFARRCGFDEPCRYWYDERRENAIYAGHRMDSTLRNKVFEENGFYKRIPFSCSAPTQALLQKWLREKHNIIIEVYPVIGFSDVMYSYHIVVKKNVYILKRFTAEQFDTYEKTLEIALYEALEMLQVNVK